MIPKRYVVEYTIKFYDGLRVRYAEEFFFRKHAQEFMDTFDGDYRLLHISLKDKLL